ncbi:DUF3298 and DUF4163 domain-containing protein [Bacillus rubiinfantis]|uniref:DUF3298 and DUF4163 domain-containing protein n=1 Tax=Bacillus rubiinfantis TaxID=1499680 RepID=UPI0005A83708|nr:anti-sigma-V factor rsiV [Bacillus rubiinfantis]
MDKRLEELKAEYKNLPIPENLDDVVQQALTEQPQQKKTFRYKALSGLVAAAAIFAVSVNVSPALAKSISDIPVIGSIVKVITFTEFNKNEKDYNASIKVPKVSNIENKQLESSLNQKYLSESKQLYQEFTKEMEKMKESGGGHLSVDSGFEVKTDDERLFSIGRYVVKTQASAAETIKYDTIDKKKQILLTLPILFKSDNYINTISENIKDQMRQEMKRDPNKVYWLSDSPGNEDLNPEDLFNSISAKQNFYINKDHKLVISFDEYEVAPGYMGAVEFTIPTKVIAKELVGDGYIK